MYRSVYCLFFVFLLLLTFSISAFGQSEKTPNKVFDAELAEKLGADQYGMKLYIFVVLKTGGAEIKDEAKRDQLFAGHFSNMSRLAEEGKLVLAGPFTDGGDKRGLFIFNVKTIEEAKKLVETDPAVKAGIFEYELTKWYGSAALMQISEIHGRIQKTRIN